MKRHRTCAERRKVGYPNKRAAARAVRSIQVRDDDYGIHFYRCVDCGKWHLGHGLPPPLSFNEGRS